MIFEIRKVLIKILVPGEQRLPVGAEVHNKLFPPLCPHMALEASMSDPRSTHLISGLSVLITVACLAPDHSFLLCCYTLGISKGMHFPNSLHRASQRTSVPWKAFWSMVPEKQSSDVHRYKYPSYLNTLSQDPISRAGYGFGAEEKIDLIELG